MRRLLSCLFAAGVTAACTHAPLNAHGECHVESGWLDATNGCSVRADYPDCWKVCADGTRERVGSWTAGSPAQPSPSQQQSH